MKEIKKSFSYRELDGIEELPVSLQQLLLKAKGAIANAYAPYSQFKVGAAALLENGEMLTGSNQENASLPVGICAERVLLSACSAVQPNIPVVALAISAKANEQVLSQPVAPCGICRQTILEYEQRFHRNIEIILQGEDGKILWFDSVKELLPLYFSSDHLLH